MSSSPSLPINSTNNAYAPPTSQAAQGALRENDGKAKTISFVIPVYRNEGAVSITCAKIEELFQTKLQGLNYEVIFVDDGSDDNSLAELLHLRARNQRVNVIELSRNFGQVAAIQAGLQEATGDCAINVSADLQDPIELVAKMITAWLNGSEIVICHREGRRDALTNSIVSSAAWAVLKHTIPKMPAGGFDFFLLDRQAVNAFNNVHARNMFMQGEVLSLGFTTHLIPYTRQERTIGKSQWTFQKRFKYFIDAIIDSTYLPIRIMSLVGFLTALSGLVYAAVVVVAWFYHKLPFNGWAPIMIVMLLIGGTIMTMLGVIGEYIWRIFDEVKGKPVYIVKNRHSVENEIRGEFEP